MKKPRKILLGFKAEFEQQIVQGLKGCTIRNERRMIPRPGDVCVGYVGLRQSNCRKVLESGLLYAGRMHIGETGRLSVTNLEGFYTYDLEYVIQLHAEASKRTLYQGAYLFDSIATLDGFKSREDMVDWHRAADNIGKPLTLYVWEPIV